jgi:hypothetical protein
VHTVHWGPSRGGTFNGKGLSIYFVDPSGPAGGGGSYYTQVGGNAGLAVDGSFGRNKLTDVRFISSKTIMSDEFARHQGRKVRYFADPDASQPLNFYDGSVREYKTGETNPGWLPSNRGSMRDRLAHRKDPRRPVRLGRSARTEACRRHRHRLGPQARHDRRERTEHQYPAERPGLVIVAAASV